MNNKVCKMCGKENIKKNICFECKVREDRKSLSPYKHRVDNRNKN